MAAVVVFYKQCVFIQKSEPFTYGISGILIGNPHTHIPTPSGKTHCHTTQSVRAHTHTHTTRISKKDLSL